MTTIHSTTILLHTYSRDEIVNEITDRADTSMQKCLMQKQNNKNKLHKNKQENTFAKKLTIHMTKTERDVSINYDDMRNKRDNTLKQYVNSKKQLQREMLKSQRYDTDQGYGDMLQTNTTWNTGEDLNIFRVGAVNINGI
jgi:NCAIR mutase (PurE)-related protein